MDANYILYMHKCNNQEYLPLLHLGFPIWSAKLQRCLESLEEHQPLLFLSEDGMLFHRLEGQPKKIALMTFWSLLGQSFLLANKGMVYSDPSPVSNLSRLNVIVRYTFVIPNWLDISVCYEVFQPNTHIWFLGSLLQGLSECNIFVRGNI